MLLIKLSSVTLREATRRDQKSMLFLPCISLGAKENSQHMVQRLLFRQTHAVPQAMKTVSAPNSAIIVIIITISSFCRYHFVREPNLPPSCHTALVPKFESESSDFIFFTLYIVLALKFGTVSDSSVSNIDFSISVVFYRVHPIS